MARRRATAQPAPPIIEGGAGGLRSAHCHWQRELAAVHWVSERPSHAVGVPTHEVVVLVFQ
jgi:hypothetical protein